MKPHEDDVAERRCFDATHQWRWWMIPEGAGDRPSRLEVIIEVMMSFIEVE